MSPKSKPPVIGITGGIGSGKSTVCRVFELLGIPVYYADERAKILTSTDPKLRELICDAFGTDAYEGNQLNKTYLAKKVFSDKTALATLNGLIHPRVAQDFKDWIEKNQDKPYLLKEAALIFETGGHLKLDKVVLVSSDEEIRISRVLARDHHRTREDVKKIISNQMPEEEKSELADYTIQNKEGIMLIPQVIRLHDTFADLSKNQGV
ncbi:MAG: dephospho-CoA kinase [Cyclobacteriaceae bacterium]